MLVQNTPELFPLVTKASLHKFITSSQFGADCLLFKSAMIRNVTLRGCSLKMNWMECLRPSWPQLESLSVQDSAKMNDRDLQYVAKHEKWKTTLRYYLCSMWMNL